jgi:hypothetical protein
MLHLPMEPEPGAHTSPGKGAILVGMNAAEVQRVVQNDLAAVPYVAGVNNHMGSRATQDAALMAEVMKTLADHRLYFIDSRTTGASAALEAAGASACRRFIEPCFWTTRKRFLTRWGSCANSVTRWNKMVWHWPSGTRTPPPSPLSKNSCRSWNRQTLSWSCLPKS